MKRIEHFYGPETPEQIQERLKDPTYLPTHQEIVRAFVYDSFLPYVNSYKQFCQDNMFYEFLNREYITALSGYLLNRINALGATENNPLMIVEVGAGNGRLTHFIREGLQEQEVKNVGIFATDNGSWFTKNGFPVERLDYKDALNKYKPDIVISSWMPGDRDWDKHFRETKNVKEYILIGAKEGSSCEAWGYNPRGWLGELDWEARGGVPLFELQGFKKVDLDALSKFQICVFDRPGRFYRSKTASFRRIGEF